MILCFFILSFFVFFCISCILWSLRAGNTWAQHGQFIRSLEFTVKTSKTELKPGQDYKIDDQESAFINIELQLNPLDWQGFSTSLDELNLVIVDARGARALPIMSQLKTKNGALSAQLPIELSRELRALRLQGKSIQPEMHHYQFMTNPIFFTEK